jgi:hypothetical protein
MIDSDTEVDGQYVAAFVESFGEVSPVFQRKAQEHFESEGLSLDNVADRTVDAKAVVDAIDSLATETGSSSMYNAGIAVGQSTPIPEDVSSVTDAFLALKEAHAVAYQSTTEQYPAGEFKVEQTAEQSVRLSATTGWPYGSAFTSGLFEGVAKQFTMDPDATEVSTNSDEELAFELSW